MSIFYELQITDFTHCSDLSSVDSERRLAIQGNFDSSSYIPLFGWNTGIYQAGEIQFSYVLSWNCNMNVRIMAVWFYKVQTKLVFNQKG